MSTLTLPAPAQRARPSARASIARALHPLLSPLRPLVRRGWLAESAVDACSTLLHPTWRLTRVMARVVGRQWVAPDMLALRLQPNANWRGARPGQHVMLTVDIAGVRHSRSYSLTGADNGRGQVLELAVRRVPGGLVSNHLIDALRPGDVVELGAPFGELQGAAPAEPGLLLLAAGSGITPLLGLARAALAAGETRPIVLLQYVRDAALQPYADALRELAALHPNLRSAVIATGDTLQQMQAHAPSAAQLSAWLSDADAHAVRACGPAPFIEAVQSWWDGCARRGSLQVEAFTPPAPDAAASALDAARSVSVRLASGRTLQLSTAQALLPQLEAAGERPAHGCRMGICNTCACRKKSGSVRDLRNGHLQAEPDETIRLCVNAPATDLELDL